MRVLAWPAFRHRERNPYTWLLNTALQREGAVVHEFTAARLARAVAGRSYDVVHVHWPEMAFNQPRLAEALARSAVLLGLLAAARRRGTRIVWTVHNAQPHESQQPALESWFWRGFLPLVDGVLYPSVTGRALAVARMPGLAALPHDVTPLGHYRDMYPQPIARDVARARLAIDARAVVFTYFGVIRPYKNVPQLVRAFRALDDADAVLLVAGRPWSRTLEAEVIGAAGGDARVRLALRVVSHEELQRTIAAADLAVLPFRDVTHSSSAICALSLDRPVLLPDRGAMGELQALAGPDWVRTYDGELTPTELADAMRWARHTVRAPSAPLDALAWPGIARRTLQLYRTAAAT